MKARSVIICITAVLIAIAGVSGVLLSRFYGSVPVIDSSATFTDAPQAETQSAPADTDYGSLCVTLSVMPDREVTREMLENLDASAIGRLRQLASPPTDEQWHDATGYTYNALYDKFVTKTAKDMGNNGKDSFTLGFTGDINFTYSAYVMTHARTMPNVVLDCIDETFRAEMEAADIMTVNNEFTYSDRGSPTPGKKYTFRAEPDTVKYMTALGVDLVSLANNHTYDYGPDSFTDTLAILDKEGIPHMGAGMNAAEAAEPATFIINGYKVGFLASSGVEWPIWTPVATESEPGIMGSYDNGRAMTAAIKKAKLTCDYVIAYPHWGYENTTSLSDAQKDLGRAFIDAGACAVVGNHSHCLQGMEFYNGAPVFYSLGNFWFNTNNVPTVLLKLTVSQDGITPSLVPGTQANSETHYMRDASSRRALYDKIESWEPYNKISISDDGTVSPNN
ncbi:MAG: CapA family protein [Clostridia bacterium]|nr:CapA family protein [Clostridia bacterium]